MRLSGSLRCRGNQCLHTLPTLAEMLSKVLDSLEDIYNKRDFPTGTGTSPSGGRTTKEHSVEDQIYYDNLSAHCKWLLGYYDSLAVHYEWLL